jgi:hypothetical protein
VSTVQRRWTWIAGAALLVVALFVPVVVTRDAFSREKIVGDLGKHFPG